MSDNNELPELKAITINGAIHVESKDDLQKREQKRKNRKSRWGNSSENSVQFQPIPAKKSNIVLSEKDAIDRITNKSQTSCVQSNVSVQMPTAIDTSTMDEKSQQIYVLKLQIQEITAKLDRPDLGISSNERDRSPSPEPVYNSKGIRINTREERTKSRLLNQRNSIITKLKLIDPNYKPPTKFKYKNADLEARVPIPAENYPDINFMGLILGPRGNYLEELKTKTKCNMVIRGKGSIKSGMTGITNQGKKYNALDEPLHVFITSDSPENVKKAVEEIKDLINIQVYQPNSEKAVALRSKHMHELAVLNGTLKEFDNKCMRCGRLGHKTWQCDESSLFSASVICSACGGIGHITTDCKHKRPGEVFNQPKKTPSKVLDKEYEEFLNDLDPDRKFTSLETDSKKSIEDNQQPKSDQSKGGFLEVKGKSIFGGNMTRLTSGYKNQKELEIERQRKKEDSQYQPVPMEWRVEQYEKICNQQQDDYFNQMKKIMSEQKKLQDSMDLSALPPPPQPPGSSKLN